MAIYGLQTSKNHNNLRIAFLILLMPLVIFICLYIFFLMFNNGSYIEKLEAKKNSYLQAEQNIEKTLKQETIEKDFSFVTTDMDKVILIIFQAQISVMDLESDISYHSRLSKDYELSTSQRNSHSSQAKELRERRDLLNDTIQEAKEELFVDFDYNEKLLAEHYYNQFLVGLYQAKIDNTATVFELSLNTFIFSLPIILLWLVIGVTMQKKIIFRFTGTKELTRKENPEVYNIVENLCISRGLPVPKIGIIDDGSMNAFATGWTKKDSYIVFSKGLLEKLDKDEIEAVAGHELTHIINGDVRTMVIANVFIGIIGTIGYILMRSGSGRSSGSKKGGNPLPLLGLLLYIASLVILPLINLAVSRKKEFLADAGSVELTKNREAMINALKKISTDAKIERIQRRDNSVASMFIFDPKKHTKGVLDKIRSIFSTHPSLESRIELLEKY